MVLPIVKLGALLLKTVSKPIASRLKKEATLHPRYRQFIINMAQANHRFTTQMQRRIYGHRTDVEILPLNEDKAVQAASDLIGELFVFSVAGIAVIYEVQRSSKSEAKKEEARLQELEALTRQDEGLLREVEALKRRLEALEKLDKEQGLRSILNIGKSQPKSAGM